MIDPLEANIWRIIADIRHLLEEKLISGWNWSESAATVTCPKSFSKYKSQTFDNETKFLGT